MKKTSKPLANFEYDSDYPKGCFDVLINYAIAADNRIREREKNKKNENEKSKKF